MGKTDKEALDHRFGHEPVIHHQSVFVQVRAKAFCQQRERELCVIPVPALDSDPGFAGMT
ncbi:MAG: hypothetical protein ISS61_01775 [Desulfobacteraceae bacterium]|nr:hypothetical protein [Desulfobacteraceae bacterium]